MKTILTTLAASLLLTTSAFALTFTDDEKNTVINAAAATGSMIYCTAKFEDPAATTKPYDEASRALYSVLAGWFANQPPSDIGSVAYTALTNGTKGKYVSVKDKAMMVVDIATKDVCDVILEDAKTALADLALINPND